MTTRKIGASFCVEFRIEDGKIVCNQPINGLTVIASNVDVLSEIERGDIWRVKFEKEDPETKTAKVKVLKLIESHDGLHHFANIYPRRFFPAIRRLERKLRQVKESHGVISREYAECCMESASQEEQLPLHYVDTKVTKAMNILVSLEDFSSIEAAKSLHTQGVLAFQSGNKRKAMEMFHHLFMCATVAKNPMWRETADFEFNRASKELGRFGMWANPNAHLVTIDVQPACLKTDKKVA